MDVLVSMVTPVIVMAVYFVEVAAYYQLAGWYYQTGPAVLRERWHTTAVDARIRQDFRRLVGTDELIGPESAEGSAARLGQYDTGKETESVKISSTRPVDYPARLNK